MDENDKNKQASSFTAMLLDEIVKDMRDMSELIKQKKHEDLTPIELKALDISCKLAMMMMASSIANGSTNEIKERAN